VRYILRYLLLNVISPLVPHPKLRSRYLRLLGAHIGAGVRIENVKFIQVQYPIANLACADNAFIGSNVTIDLSARISIGLNSLIGPGCSLITHQDFGHFNGNPLSRLYPRKEQPITIGDNVVIGADTTLLAGSEIESLTVIGAKSLVTGRVPGNCLFAGAPLKLIARHPRKLRS
jgi:acetyltransferase-like isoleucine patch superfamily enzyme